MTTYEVKLIQSDEGYAVWCPALPGCWSQGATEEEALGGIRDAITEYVADAKNDVIVAETRFVTLG